MRPHTERCWGLFISPLSLSGPGNRENRDQNEGEISTGCPGEEGREAPDRGRERIGEDMGDNRDSSWRLHGLLRLLNSAKNTPIFP